MRLSRTISAAATAVAMVGLGLLATSTATQAATVSWPAHYSAPYVDVSAYPTFNLTQSAQTSGNRFYTLAFVLNSGAACTAGWGGSTSLDSGFLQADIASLRAANGDVAVSVGGANGAEPAMSCTSAGALQAQYQRIVTNYQISHLDFDVEGATITDTTSIDLRNKAIAGLESANPNLKISYTLPVMPTALTQDGINLLKNAVTNHARVDVVNMMTMDYGSANSDMATAATSAATALVSQLGGIFSGKSAAQLWAMVGITPMIGQNDSQGELFSLANAQSVLSFANAHGLTELSFWSAGRDNGGCPGQSYASPSCSGVSQAQWAYTNTFKAFTPGSVVTPPPPPPGSCTAAAWWSSTAYVGGSVVSYNGHKWTAKWWTQGDIPGNNSQDVWVDNGTC
ncbi:MAG: chitinase [Actinomycetota bacterium]|nr:chitinase [Actinomycetota bacterium]MDQ2956464.1 chitinase [Actinomycetota bacterium]